MLKSRGVLGGASWRSGGAMQSPPQSPPPRRARGEDDVERETLERLMDWTPELPIRESGASSPSASGLHVRSSALGAIRRGARRSSEQEEPQEELQEELQEEVPPEVDRWMQREAWLAAEPPRSRSPPIQRRGYGPGGLTLGEIADLAEAERRRERGGPSPATQRTSYVVRGGSMAERLAGTWLRETSGRVLVRLPRLAGQEFEHAMTFVRGLPGAFYIGITASPVSRWQGLDAMEGHGERWDCMTVLWESGSSADTADLEQRLISACRHCLRCHNASSGGERAGFGSPHYLYIVSRASALIRRSRPTRRRV